MPSFLPYRLRRSSDIIKDEAIVSAYLKGTLLWPQLRIGPSLWIILSAGLTSISYKKVVNFQETSIDIQRIADVCNKTHQNMGIRTVTHQEVLSDILKTSDYLRYLMSKIEANLGTTKDIMVTAHYASLGVRDLTSKSKGFKRCVALVNGGKQPSGLIRAHQMECRNAYRSSTTGRLPLGLAEEISNEWLRPIKIGK